MKMKLFLGVSFTMFVGLVAGITKAEADSANFFGPDARLAESGCSIVETYKDGSQLIKTKNGTALKILTNGISFKKTIAKRPVNRNATGLGGLLNLASK